jgi:phosphatidylglycerol lysyltransferase
MIPAENTPPTSIDDAVPRSWAARLWGLVRPRLGLVLTIGVFAVALGALQHLAVEFRFEQVYAQMSSIRPRALWLAILFTACSFIALTGYDWSALRYAKVPMPYRTAAFASFTAYAISNLIGFALFVGGSIRYRIYAAAGVPTFDVAKIVVFCSSTFFFGLCATGGLGLALAPEEMAPLLRLSTQAARGLGWATVGSVLALITLSAFQKGHVHVWRWRFDVPSPSMIVLQILISSADILFAGAAMWVLLPAMPDVAFVGFLGIYCAALLATLITNIPGGVGVMESIIILGLARHAPVGALLGGMLAFRAVYYLLPFLCACMLLGFNEVARRSSRPWVQLRAVGGITSRMVPTAMAVMVFVAGVVLLMSGATPAIENRLQVLADWLPLSMLEVTHIFGSLIGLGLLILARGLYRRLDSAWHVSVLMLAAGAVASLVKGLDYEEAAILIVMFGALAACRREFYRKARLADLRLTPGWLIAIGCAVGGTVWLTVFSFEHEEHTQLLWWQFAFESDAPRALRAAFVLVLVTTAFALSVLFRSAKIAPHAPTGDEIARARAILGRGARAEANTVFLRDKALLFSENDTAFIMYAVRGRSWIALGDPVGDPADFPELIWAYREMVDRAGGRPAFYQVTPNCLPHYLDVGLTPIKLGEEAHVDLASFTLEGNERKQLRYAVRRGERDGLTFELLPKHRIGEVWDQLVEVSNAWLTAKSAGEKRFSVGWFDRDYLSEFDIAIVRVNGRVTAFANIWRGARNASIDLMRYQPDSSPYTMEFLFVELLLWAKAQGYQSFNLGMAPLANLAGREMAPPMWQRLFALVPKVGESWYNFRGLRQFKNKFLPDWQPRYLVCPSGLAPVQVVSDAMALISGGYRFVVSK